MDFSSEVSKSLAACQGVILLVDANQGVQAQTVSNFYLAFGNDLKIIPVLNKIDLPNANPDAIKEQLMSLFEIDPDEVIHASAKTGLGITEILDRVVTDIPSPDRHGKSDKLKFLLQDSWYDQYKGAVNLVQVFDGVLKINQNVTSKSTGKTYTVKSLGILTPFEEPVREIYPGQVGFFTCNMRSTSDAVIGDTFHLKDSPVEPIMEVVSPKPMVFAGIFPEEAKDHLKLKNAIEKVSLNDSSVSVSLDSSMAFGSGWRLGFLGVLHMEVFSQRLKQEYDASVVVTLPSVPYKIIKRENQIKKHEDAEILVTNPNQWIPEKTTVLSCMEPVVKGTIIVPKEFAKEVDSLCRTCRGEERGNDIIDEFR